MDLRGVRMTQNAYFSFLIHTKKLLLVTYFDTTAETGDSFRTPSHTEGRKDGRMDGQTDVEVEIVIWMYQVI